jgi:hypothetical protein
VLGDSGYGSGATRAALRAAGHLQTIKPIPLQSAVPGGFTVHDFRIDRQAGILRWPARITAPITGSGRVSFAGHCQGRPLRRRCTTAKGGRTIHLHPHEDELRAARRQAVTRTFQQRYRWWRPMVERSLAWLVADGCRWVPYRGDPAQRAVVVAAVAAVNLRRLLRLSLARRDGVEDDEDYADAGSNGRARLASLEGITYLASAVTKEYGSSWIFEPYLTCANALRRVQYLAFFLVSEWRSLRR